MTLTPVPEKSRERSMLSTEDTTTSRTDQHKNEPRPISTKHQWEGRKALGEGYDPPITERETWWRTYIRETPLPGAYETDSFLDNLRKKQNTYRFKSDGRAIDPHPHGKGAQLLPGAYNFPSFLERFNTLPATYNFKAERRDKFDTLNMGTKDRDINVSPNAYALEKYLSLSVEKQQSKHYMFRSQHKRFPTAPFKPRKGPGPGEYEQQSIYPKISVSSSFKSKTPRFSSSHTGGGNTRVPGPGTYEKTYQYPQPDTVTTMGRQHGLFFSSAFQT
ncbi:protein STPG4-like isoform X1 [Mytilus edulis]|uniref:protein STPG4-like isoform X1 n=1 Tax=Mytilus edulis TaxID=6550 RepID=UPI0039EE5718